MEVCFLMVGKAPFGVCYDCSVKTNTQAELACVPRLWTESVHRRRSSDASSTSKPVTCRHTTNWYPSRQQPIGLKLIYAYAVHIHKMLRNSLTSIFLNARMSLEVSFQ